MSLTCNFCNKTFSNVSSLNYHKDTAKYCLLIQGKKIEENGNKCIYCNKVFLTKQNFSIHIQSCNSKYEFIEKEYDECKIRLKDLEKYKLLYEEQKSIYEEQRSLYFKLLNTVQDLSTYTKNLEKYKSLYVYHVIHHILYRYNYHVVNQ